MHKARPGRGLRPFQIAFLILVNRHAPTTSGVRGGSGHGSEKRINLSKAERMLKTMHFLQSRSTSCGMNRGKLLLDLRTFVGCQGPHARSERVWVLKHPGERECCLLVLNLVYSTLPCIRRPRPRLTLSATFLTLSLATLPTLFAK